MNQKETCNSPIRYEFEEICTTRQMAERLRVRPETVRLWARTGRIPVMRLSAKSIRFSPVAVLAALSAAPAKGVDRE